MSKNDVNPEISDSDVDLQKGAADIELDQVAVDNLKKYIKFYSECYVNAVMAKYGRAPKLYHKLEESLCSQEHIDQTVEALKDAVDINHFSNPKLDLIQKDTTEIEANINASLDKVHINPKLENPIVQQAMNAGKFAAAAGLIKLSGIPALGIFGAMLKAQTIKHNSGGVKENDKKGDLFKKTFKDFKMPENFNDVVQDSVSWIEYIKFAVQGALIEAVNIIDAVKIPDTLRQVKSAIESAQEYLKSDKAKEQFKSFQEAAIEKMGGEKNAFVIGAKVSANALYKVEEYTKIMSGIAFVLEKAYNATVSILTAAEKYAESIRNSNPEVQSSKAHNELLKKFNESIKVSIAQLNGAEVGKGRH